MNGKQVKRINSIIPKVVALNEHNNVKEPDHKYIQSKQTKMIRLSQNSRPWIKKLLKKQFKRMNINSKANLIQSKTRIIYGL